MAQSRDVLAIVAPGQGAQKPGFLTPWLEDQMFADRAEWLSAVCGLDLVHYGTEADAETIRDTAIAQPLLVAAGMLSALALFPSPADAFSKVGVAAGHSVGELTAAASVGVMSAEAAMVLVRERGNEMAKASAVRPTSMTAVLGGKPEEVLARLEELGLTPANNNGKGQIVAAGTKEQLDQLAENPPTRTRLVPLSVAGAFHTIHMEPAVDRLRHLAKAVSTRDPRTRLLSNYDGQIVADGKDFLNRIVAQVAHPVRWDLCMNTMAELGVTGLLELPPAGTLTGIAKRNLRGVELFSLNTPDQLDEARDFAERHAEDHSASDLSITPSWRMVVAPIKGRFAKAEDVTPGTVLAAGTKIGQVLTLRDALDVVLPHDGTLIEWCVEDDDLVNPGQPLIRLHPVADGHQDSETS